jgi:hypothetical protein
MNHALSAGLMLAFALIFTSCTASLVQTLAIARTPQTEFVPPPDPAERRQAATPAVDDKEAAECKPAQATRQQAAPAFTPLRPQVPSRTMPKT